MTMDGITLLMGNLAEVVDRIADDVHHPAQRSFANGHGDRTTRVGGFHSPHHAISRQHRNCAHAAFTKVLLHFSNHVDRLGNFEAVRRNPQRLVNRRQMLFSKLNVDDRADDLHDFAGVSVRAASVGRSHRYSINS